jgi:phage tail-like protein
MAQVKSSYLTLGIVLVVSCAAWGGKDNRSYVTGNFFLTIDGVKCGFLKSVDGGGITADVINEPAGKSYFVKKHIGQPKYEDFQVQVGLSMTGKVYEWIAQSWSMAKSRVNGSITALDYDLQPVSERQFFNALLTETIIPAMDGTSKEPAYITLKFAPEYTRAEKPTGGKADYGQYGKNEQKVWIPANFKLEIAGLDCTKVSRIESFTVKQTVVTNDIGSARDVAKEPGKLEFPNLKITLAEAAAQSWLDWHESFVVKGNNDEASEKGGSLTFFSANLKDVLAQIKFYNMGIIRVQPEKSEANADTIKRMQVELYVERMEFVPGPKGIASGSTGTPDGGASSTPATTSSTPARTLLPSAAKTLKRAD